MSEIPKPVVDWATSQVFEISLTLILVLVAGWLLWKLAKSIWPSLKSLVTFISALGALPEFMAQTSTRVDKIYHEVFPNNGSSMRDSLTITELRIESLEAHERNDLERFLRIEAELSRRVQMREASRASVPVELTAFPADNSEDSNGTP